MPRFVLLAHDFPVPHFDLMLECENVLRTWRLDSIPQRHAIIRAEAISDHRLAYLDFEGPVSRHRGVVSRIDGGEITWHIAELNHVVALLGGTALKGRIELIQVENEWTCSFGD